MLTQEKCVQRFLSGKPARGYGLRSTGEALLLEDGQELVRRRPEGLLWNPYLVRRSATTLERVWRILEAADYVPAAVVPSPFARKAPFQEPPFGDECLLLARTEHRIPRYLPKPAPLGTWRVSLFWAGHTYLWIPGWELGLPLGISLPLREAWALLARPEQARMEARRRLRLRLAEERAKQEAERLAECLRETAWACGLSRVYLHTFFGNGYVRRRKARLLAEAVGRALEKPEGILSVLGA